MFKSLKFHLNNLGIFLVSHYKKYYCNIYAVSAK